MLSYELFGTDVYHLIACFCVYSIGGWFVESVYMSICEKKITNRGFGASPFCPIYGVGATVGYYALCRFENQPLILYLVGAIGATFFEFLVAILMKKLFNQVWWDYNDKPLNYKGILCAESTLAWGLYAIIVIRFLHKQVIYLIDLVPRDTGIIVCAVIICIYAIDFFIHLYKVVKVNKEKRVQEA